MTMDEKRFNLLFLMAKLGMAEILDKELYLPLKHELAAKNVDSSLGYKKELTKIKQEELLDSLEKDLKNLDFLGKEEYEITKAAIAFIDQLNTFNYFDHPEVKKRALELQEAVGKYWEEDNKKISIPEKRVSASSV